MSVYRQQKGSTLALVAALAFVFVLIGIFLFNMSMLLGGSRETRNAVDAGALNVGKEALTINVSAQTPYEQQFNDVADSSGNFNLCNINRVWAKAMLASINESAMESEAPNTNTALSTADAEILQLGAKSISDRLAQKLTDATQLYDFFKQLAQPNSVRMLGNKSYVDVIQDNGWQTSLVDRQQESNIAIYPDELPSTFNSAGLSLTAPLADGNIYLKGYTDMNIIGKDFWFVPFKNGEKTHLVANSNFNANLQSTNPIAWTPPVPNAFSVHGFAGQANGTSQQSMSWVMSHPQLYFKMCMPQSFIRVTIKANTLQWVVDLIPMEQDGYNFQSAQFNSSTVYPLPCGDISGTEVDGNEYGFAPSLFTALFSQSPTPPAPSRAFSYLLQRVQEILPGYKSTDLMNLLQSTPISTNNNDQDFIIYPSSTLSNATLLISPSAAAPAWTLTQPDGQDEQLETEEVDGFDCPNQGWTELGCYGDWVYPTFSTLSGDRRWTPGTGYGGCLGTMTVHRTTTAYLFGMCICPP